MDVQKTIEFLLETQVRHDGQIAEVRDAQRISHAQHAAEIAEMRQAQKLTQEAQRISHAQHSTEIAEIREMLGQTIKLVAGVAQIADQHHNRIQSLEGGRA